MTRALLVLLLTARHARRIEHPDAAGPDSADTNPPAAAKRPDCSATEHHQFDFWLGKWNVTVAGKPAGTSHIESVMKGCGILEHWSSAGGGHGTSLNFYNRRTKTWSQAWIDEGGNALHLAGTFANGKMMLASAAAQDRLRSRRAADHVVEERGRHGAAGVGVVDRRGQDVDGRLRRDLSPQARPVSAAGRRYSSRRARIRTSVCCSRTLRRSRPSGGAAMRSMNAARRRAPFGVSSITLTRRSSSDARPSHQALRFEPVDQAGDVRRVAAQAVGQLTHRDRLVGFEEAQHVALRRRELQLRGQRRAPACSA